MRSRLLLTAAAIAVLVATLAALGATRIRLEPVEQAAPSIALPTPAARPHDGHATPTQRPAADPIAAIAGAKAGETVVVGTGVYGRAETIAIPDGVTVQGMGSEKSWLQGEVTYGSNVVLRDLKLGGAGFSFANRDDSSHTLIERCRIRGGGDDTHLVILGDPYGSCSDITFRDCDIECNLGTANADHTNDCNDIRLTENAVPGGAHVSDITFEGCHVGVFNGVRSGSPRAGLEAYTWDSSGIGDITHGWSDLKIIDCVFEAADEFTIDLADTYAVGDGSVRSGPALISGCTIMGGGKAADARWGYSICIERPSGVVVEDNTILRASNNTIGTAFDTYPGTAGPIFRDNLIDVTYDNGIAARAPYIYLRGQDPQFIDNRVIADSGTIFKIENTDGVVVTGNDITLGDATLWQVWDATVVNETLSPNTVR